MNDAFFMRRALSLAERGRGRVGNGAMVGAVLVRDGAIIAEASHEGFGRPHAERSLLENVAEKILPTDTLYVNLEPCCHTGKTPPCTDLLLARGVKRLVYGMRDPDPRVQGKGLEALTEGGCMVSGPCLPAECLRLNRGYVSVRTKGRPWITLKQAVSGNGAIAHPDGSRLCITSKEQNRWSHDFLRARHDAILVGVQTVITDNPQLNTRFDQDFPLLYRLILDPSLRIPLAANVVSDERADRTIVVTSPDSDPSKKSALCERGVRFIEVQMAGHAFSFSSLWHALLTPSDTFHGITSVLVEGGPATWESFRRAGVVDEEVILRGSLQGA